MRVHTKELFYWKTEHGDKNKCQDAYDTDPQRGLFVVADGAGTTLHPAIWARILVKHFIQLPLMSEDPFEIEWWIRLAQEQYKKEIPALEKMLDWNARQKALTEGSDSTLASLRVTEVYPSSLKALLLVFGDSCVIIGRTSQQEIESFILQKPEDFERGPVCIPSELRFFRRGFHNCEIKAIELQASDYAILATDAVCKWILSAGNGTYSRPWNAFQAVCQQQPGEMWQQFIDEQRALKYMVDDDSTALVLEFREDAAQSDDTDTSATYIELHPTARHDMDLIKKRKETFEKARGDENTELMAIIYGDGINLHEVGLTLSDEEYGHNRKVADALREVLLVLQQAKNSPDLPAKLGRIWQKHVHLLLKEPCADNIRTTLRKMKIPLEPTPQPLEPAPMPDNIAAETSSSTSWEDARRLRSELAKREDSLKRVELERELLRAILSGDDDTLLEVCYKIEQSDWHLQEFYTLSPQIQPRVEQAYYQRTSLQKLQDILRNRSVYEIASAYTDAALYNKLSDDEREQIRLARQFVDAEKAYDDQFLLKVFENMHQPQYSNPFQFTDEVTKSVNIARQRLFALKRFRDVLSGEGGISPKTIVGAYDRTLLDGYPHLTEDERLQLSLAQEFERAYNADNRLALFKVHKEIKASSLSNRFAFTDSERERVELARQHLSYCVVAVSGREISREQLKKVCDIRPSYITYLKSPSYHPLFPEADAKKLTALRQSQEHLQSDNPIQLALNDLIDDLLIQEEIQKMQGGGVHPINFDLSGFLPPVLEAFKQFGGENYQASLNNYALTEEDVREVLEIFVRREVFAQYLKKLKASLEEKVKKLRKTHQIKYNYPGADRDESLRSQWLSRLLF